MKKNLILAAVFTLFAAVMSVSAQDKPAEAPKPTDFSGKWVLDISKSKLDERMRIESMTLTVAQTAKDIKTESLTKRTPPPNNMTPGGGRGGMGGMLAGTGPDIHTYSLDGKETTEDASAANPGMGMAGPRLKAELQKDGTLNLSLVRKFSTPMGEAEASTKEKWTLSADGKMLTIDRDQTTPRGSFSAKMVFTKGS
jgi:hypothetical protein